MANVDRPSGFKPYGPVLRLRRYRAAEALRQGDAVNRVGGSTETDGKSSVEMADASEALIGVAAHYVAAAGDDVLVWDHPDQEFEVQADGSDINNGVDIGLNYDLLATVGSGQISAHELDSSTGATTATLPLKILRLKPAIDNALGAQAKVIVKINNHQLGSHTGTAGV